MGKCIHDPSPHSTLKLFEFKLANLGERMFACMCMSCGRTTELRETRYQAQTDAWYGCWEGE